MCHSILAIKLSKKILAITGLKTRH